MKNKKCPRCDEAMSKYPALSRRDNKTDICSACGQDEAMVDYAKSVGNHNFVRESSLITDALFVKKLEKLGLKS